MSEASGSRVAVQRRLIIFRVKYARRATAIREGNGRRYVGEEVVAGRQGHAKNIAPSFHLSSALAYI